MIAILKRSHNMRKQITVIGSLLALLLVSCRAGGPSTTIDVTTTDFAFTPNAFTVPAGQEITLNVINNGAVVHNFVIMKLGANAGDAFGEEDQENVFWEERDIEPGGDISVTF